MRSFPWRLVTLLIVVGAVPLTAQRPAEQAIVWPLPPEQPRIQYVGQLSTEADIGKSEGFFSRMTNRLAGTKSSVIGLQRPHDVYVDDGTRFFVSDGARGKVLLFNSDTHEATIIGEGGAGNLRKPMGLGGDGRGTVYVADASGSRVVAYDRDGVYLNAYGGEEVLHNPVDVAADADRGLLHVVDSYLHQVVTFSIETGEVLNRIGRHVDDLAAKRTALGEVWEGGIHGAVPDAPVEGPTSHAGTMPRDLVGNRGSAEGEFRYPAFVAVAPNGRIYVSDQMNFRIQAFSPEGEFVHQVGQIGRTPGSFSRPKGIGVDSEGHVYVADGLFNNVQVFDADGRLLIVFGKVGVGEGEMYLPLGLHVDARNRVFVADRFNDRIQVFQYLPVGEVVAGSETPR